jgi:hypothetical protein
VLGSLDCAALSYVIEKQWYWLKGYAGTPVQRAGVISSMR